MYNMLKKEAKERVLKEGVVNETLLTDFSHRWAALIQSHINKMNPTEARVACKVVLQTMGINPDLADNPANHIKDTSWQPKQPTHRDP